MNITLPVAGDQKLVVEFRVEPGCLGPQGHEHVEGFCRFAQRELAAVDAGFIHWELTARHDKSLPEIQYKINNKSMTRDKAAKYLAVFEKSLDEFENDLEDKIINLVEQYLGR